MQSASHLTEAWNLLKLNQMVKYSSRQLDAVYGAISHSVRRRILDQLGAGEATVTELAEPYAMSLPAVSKHIRALEDARLVHRTIAGREHRLRLEAAPLMPATAWLESYRGFWETRLDLLDRRLRERSGR